MKFDVWNFSLGESSSGTSYRWSLRFWASLTMLKKTSKSAVHYWVQSFKEKVRISIEAKHRETAALDLERNEILWMRVYAAGNHLTAVTSSGMC